jgi:hypothetical protein
MRSRIVAWTAALAMVAGSASAQSRGFQKPTRFAIGISGGVQQAASDVTDRFSFLKNVETETVDVRYPMKPWALVDAGVSYRVWKNLAFAIAVSRLTGSGSAEVSASLPHPFFFGQPRTVSGTENGVVHTETDAHVQVQFVVPSTSRLHVVLGAGPSYLRAEHEVVTDVTVVESYPFDTASFGGAVTRLTRASASGFNAGVDVAWMFTRSAGVGGLLRYTRADVNLSAVEGRTLAMKAGGVQAGVGVRLVF